VYDADLVADAQLANISTRGFVGDDNLLIAGVVVGVGAADVVVRALGHSLIDAGIANPLADPILELHDANGGVITNDDWQNAPDSGLIPPALQPRDTHESALRTSLAAGPYTVVVRGAANTKGVALVEAYNLQSLPASR
jgi:hypothetical protein